MSNQTLKTTPQIGGGYSHYVLAILMLVYAFNFIDRNILTILAEDIKADLDISDGELGFLYGTVFAVFYAVFGIPLARFADVWSRRSLISIGLSAWSLMTAASGLARSFGALAVCRIGVGIGEASASPAALSLLADYYAPKWRATVFAIYSSGLWIGAGFGMFLGGYVLDYWSTTYPTAPPFGLKGWQVAFMVVGLPGLLLAVWVRTLREPERGVSEGLTSPKHPAPFQLLGNELMSVIPLLNLYGLRKTPKALFINATAATCIILITSGLILITGSIAQWSPLAMGLYIAFSWAQSLRIRDPAAFAMIFRCKAFMYSALAFPVMNFAGVGSTFWIPPLLIRTYDTGIAEIGLYIGLGTAVGGFIGTNLGGFAADYLRRLYPSGRLILGYPVVAGMTPILLLLLHTESLTTAFWLYFLYMIPVTAMGGALQATATDLVMPRMRALAAAVVLLANTFIAFALGPYIIGQLSDVLQSSGINDVESLRIAIMVSTLVFIPALILLFMAQRHLPNDEASRLERARALGEKMD